MDIERKDLAVAKKRRQMTYGAVAVFVIVVVSVGIARLEPAAPSVERNAAYIDTVKRGPMLRQVRGTGSLVPREFRWIPAATEGRVESIFVEPGEEVTADTIVMELSEPRQIQSGLDAEFRLRAAEADYQSLLAQLEGSRLEQESTIARLKAEWEQAKLRADADEQLAQQGLIADISRQISKTQADELGNRYTIEIRRLESIETSSAAQLAAQRATLAQMRALYELQKNQVDSLKVRAGIDGVLQELQVEVGQRISQGTTLAKVIQPKKLKAELRIVETQARDIQIGQPASIDTRNGLIEGRVSRIDPAAQGGSVTIDVTLTGELPRGARPDLTVDGTIELERLDDVLYVGRPVHAVEDGTIGLFRLTDNGVYATRVNVRVGRTSVSTIEVVDGLVEGDEVILSDMSNWDEFDRVKLK